MQYSYELSVHSVHCLVIVAGLESGICKDPGFAPTSGHLVLCVLSASETGLLLVVKLGRNVVMMRAGVKIMCWQPCFGASTESKQT